MKRVGCQYLVIARNSEITGVGIRILTRTTAINMITNGATECIATHKGQCSASHLRCIDMHYLNHGQKREKDQAHNSRHLQSTLLCRGTSAQTCLNSSQWSNLEKVFTEMLRASGLETSHSYRWLLLGSRPTNDLNKIIRTQVLFKCGLHLLCIQFCVSPCSLYWLVQRKAD